jgi:hypothetical protein
MDIMATDAHRNLLISCAKSLTMNTGIISPHLIRPNGRIKRPHIVGIAVALPAGFRDRLSLRFAYKPFDRTVALRLIVDCSLIAAVAALTAQPTRQMVIVFNLDGWTIEAFLSQSDVAVNAGVRRLREGDADQAGHGQEEAQARNAQHDPHGCLI